VIQIATLSGDDVLRIHDILAADFARSNDPISPPGLRDRGLLESAVGRQFTGSQSRLKYATPIDNAATLLYGICNDHPFHNGNKRTALVAMLVHLDRNKLILKDTNQNELFEMILGVAAHSIVTQKRPGRSTLRWQRASADEEVAAVAEWIRRRAAKPRRGERQITYRELRRVLAGHGFALRPSDSKGNAMDIFKAEEERRLFRKPRMVQKRIGTIGYCDDGTIVSLKDLKMIRRICNLTEEDGIDSDAFYDQEAIVDAFINKYRKTLWRLSKR
jgi:death-on-curing family protein